MTDKHTKGKWLVDDEEPNPKNSQIIYSDDGDEVIASTVYGNRSKANANRIVAEHTACDGLSDEEVAGLGRAVVRLKMKNDNQQLSLTNTLADNERLWDRNLKLHDVNADLKSTIATLVSALEGAAESPKLWIDLREAFRLGQGAMQVGDNKEAEWQRLVGDAILARLGESQSDITAALKLAKDGES